MPAVAISEEESVHFFNEIPSFRPFESSSAMSPTMALAHGKNNFDPDVYDIYVTVSNKKSIHPFLTDGSLRNDNHHEGKVIVGKWGWS